MITISSLTSAHFDVEMEARSPEITIPQSSLPTVVDLKVPVNERQESSCSCFGGRRVAKKPVASAAFALANILKIDERRRTTPLRLTTKDINEAIQKIYEGHDLFLDLVTVLKETKGIIKRDRALQSMLKLPPVTSEQDYARCVQFLTHVALEVGTDVCELFRKSYTRDILVIEQTAPSLLTDPANNEEFLITCDKFFWLRPEEKMGALRSCSTDKLRKLLERASANARLSQIVNSALTERTGAIETIKQKIVDLRNFAGLERELEPKHALERCGYNSYHFATEAFYQLRDEVTTNFAKLDSDSKSDIHSHLENSRVLFFDYTGSHVLDDKQTVRQEAFKNICTAVGIQREHVNGWFSSPW